jgi:hypothetical protein
MVAATVAVGWRELRDLDRRHKAFLAFACPVP